MGCEWVCARGCGKRFKTESIFEYEFVIVLMQGISPLRAQKRASVEMTLGKKVEMVLKKVSGNCKQLARAECGVS